MIDIAIHKTYDLYCYSVIYMNESKTKIDCNLKTKLMTSSFLNSIRKILNMTRKVGISTTISQKLVIKVLKQLLNTQKNVQQSGTH